MTTCHCYCPTSARCLHHHSRSCSCFPPLALLCGLGPPFLRLWKGHSIITVLHPSFSLRSSGRVLPQLALQIADKHLRLDKFADKHLRLVVWVPPIATCKGNDWHCFYAEQPLSISHGFPREIHKVMVSTDFFWSSYMSTANWSHFAWPWISHEGGQLTE